MNSPLNAPFPGPTLDDHLSSFERSIRQAEPRQRAGLFLNSCREAVRLFTVGREPRLRVLDGLRAIGLSVGLSEIEVEAALTEAEEHPFNPTAGKPIGSNAKPVPTPPTPPRRRDALLRPARPEIVRVGDVEPLAVDWLWRGYLAKGKLTIIAGDPGLGKTQVALDMAARISVHARWPDGEAAPSGSVIILSAEDGVADTIRPRLELAGADLLRIHVLTSVVESDGAQRSFNLQADLATLGQAIEERRDVTLVIIDPITAYMGMIDSHRTTDVRAVQRSACKVR